jgi:isochorismate synthase
LSDFLKYRFPGEEIVFKKGDFKLVDPSVVKSGFIITNFDMSKCFLFKESSEEKNEELKHFFSMERPYVMTAREYYLQAHELLNGINHLQMEKAVFSRIKKVNFSKDKIDLLFTSLEKKYPNAFIYLASSKKFGTWVGASPEILMEAHNDFMFTMSLAGTKKVSEQDETWGEKEKEEQKIVTDYITSICQKMQLTGIETEGPYDFQAGPILHLKTDISAYLNGRSPWLIAQKIHPSPAISGFPVEIAINLILSVEPHNRGLYTGAIGFISEKKAKLYVNLRCAQIYSDAIYLYLGGGFTNKSIPDLEYVETEQKSKTLLNIIKEISNK